MDRAKKVVNEKHESILLELSKQPGNDTCADCGAKAPRWASYNLGIFLCIRCCGFHRKMGTHISKVKSISLDSWTPEQIESMRQWGNLKANAKWNPHPELHPVSISASDGEIERYIRNKYERMAYRDKAPQPKNSTSSTPSKRIITKNVDQGNYDLALRQLRDMGFTDMTRNREVLATTNGDLSSSIEILCRLPGGNPKPALLNTNTTNTSGTSNTPPKSDDEKLTHLKSLGFHDDTKNREILRRTGGNLEVAITLLTESRSSVVSENTSRLTSSNPLQVQSQMLVGALSSSQNPGSQQMPGQNQSPNLWEEFTQGSANMQLQQQQQKAKLDKNAILSLYNTPQPSAYNGMNQIPQFGTLGSGMMQNQTGQFGIPSTGMMHTGQFSTGMNQPQPQPNQTGQFSTGMNQPQQNQIGQFSTGMNQPQQNQTGQLGFPIQKNDDFGLNSTGTSNSNTIPYGNASQQMGLTSGAFAGIPANNINSFGAGGLNNGYGGLNPLSNGYSGLSPLSNGNNGSVKNPAANYGYGGMPGSTANNSTTVMQNNINATSTMGTMGTLNQQSSIPLGNTQPAFALNAINPMNFGGPNPSYSTMTPNGGMNQQQSSPMLLYGLQHTGGYPNGQQNHGFQNTLL